MSNATSEPVFRGGGIERRLTVRRDGRAKAMRLSVHPHRGEVRLTLPRRAAVAPALAWALGKRDWIETRLAEVPARRMIEPGGSVPVDGVERLIDWRAEAPRRVLLQDDRLIVGGPGEAVAARIARWLRVEALERLSADTARCADRAGVPVMAVRVGDPGGRWGSCTAAGAIRYSWRLIMAPAAVREAVVAHEVAHRLHMNHSPAFHAAVAALLGRQPIEARRWLREHGAALHAIEACGGECGSPPPEPVRPE